MNAFKAKAEEHRMELTKSVTGVLRRREVQKASVRQRYIQRLQAQRESSRKKVIEMFGNDSESSSDDSSDSDAPASSRPTTHRSRLNTSRSVSSGVAAVRRRQEMLLLKEEGAIELDISPHVLDRWRKLLLYAIKIARTEIESANSGSTPSWAKISEVVRNAKYESKAVRADELAEQMMEQRRRARRLAGRRNTLDDLRRKVMEEMEGLDLEEYAQLNIDQRSRHVINGLARLMNIKSVRTQVKEAEIKRLEEGQTGASSTSVAPRPGTKQGQQERQQAANAGGSTAELEEVDEDSLLGRLFLTSDLHSIPVRFPDAYYRQGRELGGFGTKRLHSRQMMEGFSQLKQSRDPRIAVYFSTACSKEMVEIHLQTLVPAIDAWKVVYIVEACVSSDGSIDAQNMQWLLDNPLEHTAPGTSGDGAHHDEDEDDDVLNDELEAFGSGAAAGGGAGTGSMNKMDQGNWQPGIDTVEKDWFYVEKVEPAIAKAAVAVIRSSRASPVSQIASGRVSPLRTLSRSPSPSTATPSIAQSGHPLHTFMTEPLYTKKRPMQLSTGDDVDHPGAGSHDRHVKSSERGSPIPNAANQPPAASLNHTTSPTTVGTSNSSGKVVSSLGSLSAEDHRQQAMAALRLPAVTRDTFFNPPFATADTQVNDDKDLRPESKESRFRAEDGAESAVGSVSSMSDGKQTGDEAVDANADLTLEELGIGVGDFDATKIKPVALGPSVTRAGGIPGSVGADSQGQSQERVPTALEAARQKARSMPRTLRFSKSSPLVHVDGSQIHTVRVRCDLSAPVENIVLRRAAQQVSDMNKEVEYAKQDFRHASRHARKRFYQLRNHIERTRSDIRLAFQARAAQFLLESEAALAEQKAEFKTVQRKSKAMRRSIRLQSSASRPNARFQSSMDNLYKIKESGRGADNAGEEEWMDGLAQDSTWPQLSQTSRMSTDSRRGGGRLATRAPIIALPAVLSPNAGRPDEATDSEDESDW